MMLVVGFLAGSAPAQFLPWRPVESLGGGLAGVSGVPSISVSGMLAPGEVVVFSVDNAAPNAVVVLVVGASIINLPIFGGIIIPSPDVLISTTSDSSGHAEVSIPWTAGLMTTSFWQWGVTDPSAVEGVAISKAVAVNSNEYSLTDATGTYWGKIRQSADGKVITIVKHDGSITSWARATGTTWFEDGNGNKLTLTAAGSSTSVHIDGGQHAGVYSAQ